MHAIPAVHRAVVSTDEPKGVKVTEKALPALAHDQVLIKIRSVALSPYVHSNHMQGIDELIFIIKTVSIGSLYTCLGSLKMAILSDATLPEMWSRSDKMPVAKAL